MTYNFNVIADTLKKIGFVKNKGLTKLHIKMNFYCFILMFMMYLTHSINADDGTYSTKYDNVDLDQILSNDRLLTGYVNCLLDKSPCTPDGKELKKNLPDAIQNDCTKCTEKQKEGADKVMHHIIDNRPDDWTKLEEKYESDGSYKERYLQIKTNEGKAKEDNDIKIQ